MISTISPSSIGQHVERERAIRVVARARARSSRPRAGGWRASRRQREPRRSSSVAEAALDPDADDRVAPDEDARLGRHREAQRPRASAPASACASPCLAGLDVARAAAPARPRSPRRVPLAAALGQVLLQARPRALQRAVDRRRRSCRAARPVSFARQPSTSRRISTARGRGGRCWIATMNASSIVSRATTSASGSSSSAGIASSSSSGIRLQPRDLAARRRRARALLERVQAGVGRDPVQPRAQRRAARVGLARAPRAQERLLREVLGLLEGAEHPVAVDLQLAAVALDERREGGLVGQLESGHVCVTAVGAKTHRRQCYHGAPRCTHWRSKTWSSAIRRARRRSRASRWRSRRASSSACSGPTAPASRR